MRNEGRDKVKEEKKKMPERLDNELCWRENADTPNLTDDDLKEIIRESRKLCSQKEMQEYSLDQFLSQITPENVHKEMNDDEPKGKEIW